MSKSPKSSEYEKALEATLRVMRQRRGRPLSAREIAEKLGCSKPTVYDRIAALRARGVRFATATLRVGRRGPPAVTFVIAFEPGHG